ncbi:MAG: hypothetical protein ABSC18_16400 [Verrucomicrobiota bacterium]
MILTLLGAAAMARSVPAAPAPSTTYSNLARAALLKRAEEVSHSLTEGGFLPAESFTNATVVLEGQSTHPSATVFASCCDYVFNQGFLVGILRRDLFEDKGPDSLIIRHLTNEVLTLTPQAATNRALEVLRRLSHPTNGLQEVFEFYVHDDIMMGVSLQDAGPNFPKDLILGEELRSRKKIKITVGMHPAGRTASAEPGSNPGDCSVDFLATTGELLEARPPWKFEVLSGLGIQGLDQITLPEASDFAPPLFVSATRKLTGAETRATDLGAEALVREAWHELATKLGSNRPQCIFIFDNLNNPADVAAAVRARAGETPWAGVSRFFRMDLPFDRALMERLAQDKRGVSLLAICGRVETRLELLSGLNSVQMPTAVQLATPDGQQRSKQLYDQERQRLAPRLGDLVDRLRLPQFFPDHALFLLQGGNTYPSSDIVVDELQSRLLGKAQVVGKSVGPGVTYFNGKFFTNAMVVLRLSGFLPYSRDF